MLARRVAKLSRLFLPALPPASCALRCQHTESETVANDSYEEFRENIREFASRSIAPHAAEIDRNNAFPASINLWTAMGDFGLHGMAGQASIVLGAASCYF